MELEFSREFVPAKRGIRVAKPVKTAKCLLQPARQARVAAPSRQPRSHQPMHLPASGTLLQRLHAFMLPAVAGLALGGCVAAPVSETLESAALASPETTAQGDVGETALFADGENLANTPFASVLATVPVPTRAPTYGGSGEQLALLSEDTATQAPAAEAAEGDLETAALASDETIPAPQAAPADGSAAATIGEPVKPAQEIAGAQPLRQQKAQQPKKPGGLFGLFMANRQAKPKKIIESKEPAIASASGFGGANAGLPGVQRKNAIFGINGGENAAEPDVAGQQNIQVASVGGIGRLISPTGLILQTDKVEVGCFKPELLTILKRVERRYGKKVMVTSGYRSPKRNRRAGGVSNSTHIYCKAADIQVEGVSKWDLAKYLRSIEGRGGVGTYCRTNSVHIDVGSQRDWHHPCRRSGSRSKKKKA